MVGVGAIAGTVSGGYTNAARSPAHAAPGAPTDDRSHSRGTVQASVAAQSAIGLGQVATQQVATQQVESQQVESQETVVVKTAGIRARQSAAPEVPAGPAPAAVIAERFPAQWQRLPARGGNGDNDAPAQVLAYAAEQVRADPIRAEPARTEVTRTEVTRAESAARSAPAPRPAAAGFQLASVDPTPPMPKSVAKPAQPKPAVLFNDAQLASIKARLKLTRDQEAYWPPVEQALRAISWKLATQQQQNPKRPVTGNQAAMIDPNSPEVSRLKSAAFPLIMSMRSEQKEEVRQLAHTMGLKQVAAMF